MSLLSVNGFISRKGYCSWYGQANIINPLTQKLYNHYYNGPAKDVQNGTEFFNLLNETCPWLITEKTKACCDLPQLRYLQNQTAIVANLVQRCPACYRNFMRLFCTTTCSPDISTFIDVIDRTTNTSFVVKPQEYLSQVNVYVTNNFASRLYNSCKDVEYPEQSGKVMSLMCGTNDCNGTYWLRFLGDPSLDYGQAPFLMKYIFTDRPPVVNMTSLNLTLLGCDDTNSNYTCSCTDCPSPRLCPSLPPQTDTWPHTHFLIVVIVLTCGLFTTTVTTIICYIYALVTFVKSRSVGKDDSLASSSSSSVNGNSEFIGEDTKSRCGPCMALAQVGAWMEFVIKTIFYHWGMFAAKFWFLVLPITVLIFACLGVGAVFFRVTTDPVKLWSSPGSRARQEKEYFDKNFNPFYRTAQIIIRPKEDYGTFSIYPLGTQPMEFGSAMQRDVLIEAFHLQQELSSIVAHRKNGSNVTLQDICFKPLYPDNNKCTIESIFNYFQNDNETFFYKEVDTDFPYTLTYNASYHIDFCTKYVV